MTCNGDSQRKGTAVEKMRKGERGRRPEHFVVPLGFADLREEARELVLVGLRRGEALDERRAPEGWTGFGSQEVEVPNPNLVAARRREWCGGRRGRGERVAARSGRAARWGERRRAGGGAERASSLTASVTDFAQIQLLVPSGV
jgi:hypothetical protein